MFIFHVYISYPWKYALYRVTYGLVPKHVLKENNAEWLVQATVTQQVVFIISVLIYWYLVKKMGMYSWWSESFLQSKAKSLNVRPIKPHIHANLKFVCATFVHFYVHVVCVWGGVWILSIIVGVMRPLRKLWFYYYYYFLLLTLMSNFCPTDWKFMGNRTRIGNNKKNGDPFYGQTLCHTWVAKPRYHCIVSPRWVLPIGVGWRQEHVRKHKNKLVLVSWPK